MILFPYAGDTRGGSVHSSYLLIGELLKRGRSVLVALHGQGFAGDLAREQGLPQIHLAALGSRAEFGRPDRFRMGNLTAVREGRRVVAQHAVRLVHVNDKRMLRTWCLPARMAGARLLSHWRSAYVPSWSIDLGLRLAARIVCVSEYSRDRLPAWARAKSAVIYNPFQPIIDVSRRAELRNRIRDAAGIPREAAVIGIFGALLERKRPHVLLKILQRVETTADGRPVYGVVCGESLGPRDELFFQMMADRDWRGRVVTPGHVSNVGEWMAACDVMIAPAENEPLARVGVEAQSVGLPAIVSSDGGLREVVEHNVSGLLVDPRDLEGWVSEAHRVINDRDLGRRLSSGGIAAAARLTVARHADAIEAIYDELLGRGAT